MRGEYDYDFCQLAAWDRISWWEGILIALLLALVLAVAYSIDAFFALWRGAKRLSESVFASIKRKLA